MGEFIFDGYEDKELASKVLESSLAIQVKSKPKSNLKNRRIIVGFFCGYFSILKIILKEYYIKEHKNLKF